VILYQFPGREGLGSISPPCLKVEMALRLLGVEYQLVNLRRRPEVRRVSTTGRLPVLEIDGRRIPDSIAILDELERLQPQAALWPEDPAARVRDRLWEHFANDHVYYLGVYLRWFVPEHRERVFGAIFRGAPLPVRWIGPRMLRREFSRRIVGVGLSGKTQDQVLAAWERASEMHERGLAGGPYLEGRERPGRGDLAVASLAAEAGLAHAMPEIERRFLARPAVVEHVRRVFEACSMELPDWLERGRPTP